ncbi:MAG: hypothetical protein RLZZ437_1535, partial [Pseudomonadota bacterium]
MIIDRRKLSIVGASALLSSALPGRLSAQTAGTLDEVKKRGTLRIGVTQAPPWYSKDPGTGQWSSGVGIAVGNAMATALGVKLEPVEVTWGTAIAALQTN